MGNKKKYNHAVTEIYDRASRIQETSPNFTELSQEVKNALIDITDYVENLQDENFTQGNRIDRLEEMNSDLEQKADDNSLLESFPCVSVLDTMKLKIFARLHKNITLEQATKIEADVKASMKTYVDLTPEELIQD